jgi:hypothetical protein
MTTTAATEARTTEVGKEALAFRPGHRYGLLTDDKGTTLSVHDCETPGLVWISGFNARGYSRAARLDLGQAVALRAMLDRWIADQPPIPTTQP